MAGETNSPNMNLPIPGVAVTDGPQWASDLNSSLTLIDQHDHSPGAGVKISPNGLNINADLPFNDNNALSLRSARFQLQGSPLSLPDDLACLYALGVDLYFNDANGNQIQITSNGGVAGSPGSISNLTPPASASYVSGSSTFVWQSGINTPANMDLASLILRNLSAGSHGLTLSPPNAMAADITMTLPTLPGSGTKFMQMASSGNMSASLDVDNSTLQISGSTLSVKTIGTSQLAAQSVTQAKLAVPPLNTSSAGGAININGSYTVIGSPTITIQGTRPVMLILQANSSSSYVSIGPNSYVDAKVFYGTGGSQVVRYYNTGGTTVNIPPANWLWIITPADLAAAGKGGGGSTAFSLEMLTSSVASVQGCTVLAMEL